MKNKLTMEVIQKIVENCKISSEFVSQDEDQDYEFWDIRVLKEKEFKQYTVMHYFAGDEDYENESWSIFSEDGTDIIEKYEFAIDKECEDYTLDNFIEEYGYSFEDNEEIIELMEKYDNTVLEL